VTRFEALVEIQLRPGIADPQGATIERSLPTLGFANVTRVRAGKAIRLVVEATDEDDARAQLDELCRRFLTNPVIEAALVTVEGIAGELAGEAADEAAGEGAPDGAGAAATGADR